MLEVIGLVSGLLVFNELFKIHNIVDLMTLQIQEELKIVK